MSTEKGITGSSWQECAFVTSAWDIQQQQVRCLIQEEAIPGFTNVDDIDAVGACLPQVRLHVDLEVL